MLQVSAWVRILVAIIIAGGMLIALPNALPANMRAHLPGWLPHDTVSLGLDLQGGSYLLLEVDLNQVWRDKIEATIGDVRAGFRKAHILYTAESDAAKGTVTVHVLDAARMDDARKVLQDLNPLSNGTAISAGMREYQMNEPGGDTFLLTMTSGYRNFTQVQLLQQSIEVVRRRIDAMGTREPDVTPSGDNRIVVQVPGLQDPTELKEIIGKTAKMTFQMVDDTADAAMTARGQVPVTDEALPDIENGVQSAPVLAVERRVVVSGDRLTDASQGFSQETGQPVVNFRFDSVGARQFGDATKNNVGRRFAIVLDNQVISAPRINTAILAGSGYIEGNFTVQTANNLAILLRAGALPAPLNVIAERTVGAALGADSIKAGSYSALGGLVLVVLFMIGRYGLFGLFADVALTLNIVLLLAALTLFGATLTLPGIAGIVLTMGMAVDANVLIYERIREEQRGGRSILASIDTGFRRAMATIIDANMTHLIAALILFELGSGPVRGFAVTLGVGIITSFFTAVMVTRLIVIWWLHVARPKHLTI